MRKMQRIVASAIAAGGLCAGTASAAVYFQDDLESQAIGTVIGAPPVGSWVDSSSGPPPTFGANLINIASSPAIGTRSIQADRFLGSEAVSLKAISLPGAIADGNTVEVKWSHYLDFVHVYNAAMQIGIGNENGDLTYVATGDGQPNITYTTGPSGTTVASSTRPTLTAWDDFRAVMTLSQVDATHIGGNMDLWVRLNGAATETVLASGVSLKPILMGTSDPTSMRVLFTKGAAGASGTDYYDNISITATAVPEPASLALGGLVFGLLTRRNRK